MHAISIILWCGTITANYGAGATGGPTFTQGAATGVGAVSQSFSSLKLNTATTRAFQRIVA